MIKISVIMPAYNESATILQILNEVKVQSVDGCEFEVIVIDDGSTDNTRQILTELRDHSNKLRYKFAYSLSISS